MSFLLLSKRKWETSRTVRFIAKDEQGDWVATAKATFPTPGTQAHDQNKHAWMWIHVNNEHRRKGIGTQLLLNIAKVCGENEIEKIGIQYPDGPGTPFCQRYGGNLHSQRHVKLLKLKSANWPKALEWQKGSVAEAEGVKLEYYLDIPETMLPEYLNLVNICGNDATDWTEDVPPIEVDITEEIEFRKHCKEQNTILFTLLARDASGNLVGITEISTLKTEQLMLHQRLTGVVRSYRCKGLGKWLKSELLLWIRDNIPDADCIITGNNDFNHGVNHINYSLGYKDVFKEYDAQLDVKELLKNQGE
jgi:GNAT superfamily N-acetyltransferase